MGINNLCKLIDAIAPPSDTPAPFDSLLIDAQSFLYVAIEQSLETREDRLFHEICQSTWKQLYALLKLFLTDHLVVVLSFDGEGVPMKWATQRERRNTKNKSQKSFYRYVLFGNNRLTLYVQDYLLEKLKQLNYTFTVLLAGCNVPGEGEHKIFHLAESFPGCRNPLVISVDQDVFILSLLRLSRYQTLQIYRYKKFYPLARLATRLPYSLKRFLDVSFLFGNDFIPVLVGITPNKVPSLHDAMTFQEEEEEDVPAVLAAFLARIQPRFYPVESVDRLLVVCFWITHFWILDYYTRRHFPQQFLENRVYDAFDRNQLLTALADVTYSRSTYDEARETYGDLLTQPIPHAERHIFSDPELLGALRSYWTEPQNGFCNLLRLTRTRKRGAGSLQTGTETAPKRERI